MKMAYWIGGAAVAALMMAGVPVMAQTNTASPPAASPSESGASSGNAGTQAPSTMKQGQQQRKHTGSRAQRHKKSSQARSGSSGPTTQELNQQELQRLDQTSR